MGNERYHQNNVDDEEDSNTTSGSTYKGPAYHPVKLPSSLVRNEAPEPKSPNIITVPLWGMEERARLMHNNLEAKAEGTEEEEDEDDETGQKDKGSSNRNAPVKTKATSVPKAVPAQREAFHDDIQESDEHVGDNTVAPEPLPVSHIPSSSTRQEGMQTVRQAESSVLTMEREVAEQEDAHVLAPTQSPHPTRVQPVPYQRQAEYTAPTNNRDVWSAGYADHEASPDYGLIDNDPEPPRGSGGSPPKPPAQPPAESMGFAEPPEDGDSLRDMHARGHYAGSAPGMVEQQASSPDYSQINNARRYEQAAKKESRNTKLILLLAGGLLFERSRRKGGDRNLEKRINALNRRHEDVLRTQNTLTNQQQQFRNEQQWQRRDMQRVQEVQERFNTQSAARTYENTNRPVVTEQRPLPPITAPEQRKPAQPVQEQAPDDTMQQANERLRFVTDAWLSHAVDNKNREVQGVIERGAAYYDERKQEIIRDATADAIAKSRRAGSSAVSVMGVIAIQSGPGVYQQYEGSLPSGLTSPALPAGQPSADPQHQLAAHNPMRSNVGNPWFWLMLALIVAAFFTAALI
jgi:hypothetical protein